MTSQSSRPPLSVAVLISGGGTTLRNLLEKIAAGVLHVEIRLVISSNVEAAGLEYARRAGIPVAIYDPKQFVSPEAYSNAVFGCCREAGVEIVTMAGFLKHILIPGDFINRVVNIHPSLIPAFCGHGFYGLRVHRAVLEYGAKLSGCTVHFVDNQYDHGPIILQRAVEVCPDDTPETLAARVFAAECQAYPDALNLLAAGRIEVRDRLVRVRPAE